MGDASLFVERSRRGSGRPEVTKPCATDPGFTDLYDPLRAVRSDRFHYIRMFDSGVKVDPGTWLSGPAHERAEEYLYDVHQDGMELVNGYCELTDAREQRQRFERDNALRRARGQPERPVDENLLAALAHGLPDCSGVALGIDRLLMLATGASDIRDVLAFDWERS